MVRNLYRYGFSPQETTSTTFTATSPSTTEDVGTSPLNESLHSPPNAQNEIQTKPCTSCRLHAVRSSELEAALLAKGHELEKFKEMMRAVSVFFNVNFAREGSSTAFKQYLYYLVACNTVQELNETTFCIGPAIKFTEQKLAVSTSFEPRPTPTFVVFIITIK